MTTLSTGDQVICIIKNKKVVNVYEDKWDEKAIFDIVSVYEEGYLIYIPSSFIFLEDVIYVKNCNYNSLKLHKKFIDSYVLYITEYNIFSVHCKLDGMFCSSCGQFFSMAVPNQPDEKTMICWSCRKYPVYL